MPGTSACSKQFLIQLISYKKLNMTPKKFYLPAVKKNMKKEKQQAENAIKIPISTNTVMGLSPITAF